MSLRNDNLRLYRDQILVLVQKDFKLKYNATALGFAWCLLVPLLMSGVYYLVFGLLLKVGRMPNYLLYLISGNFLWQFFSSVVMMNGSVLAKNASLLKKTNFNRQLLVWSTFFSEGLHFVLVIPVMVLIMMLYSVTPQWWSILPNLVVSMVALALLSVGIGYLYAALNLIFRDLERIMVIIMRIWLYASPVFIPISAVPERFMKYYLCNPMASILTIWRNIFYTPQLNWKLYPTALLISAVVFLLGRAVFTRLQPVFAEKM